MSAFQKIAAGLEDAIGYAEGTADPAVFQLHIPASVDVKAIRKGLRLSQEALAAKYGRRLDRPQKIGIPGRKAVPATNHPVAPPEQPKAVTVHGLHEPDRGPDAIRHHDRVSR